MFIGNCVITDTVFGSHNALFLILICYPCADKVCKLAKVLSFLCENSLRKTLHYRCGYVKMYKELFVLTKKKIKKNGRDKAYGG